MSAKSELHSVPTLSDNHLQTLDAQNWVVVPSFLPIEKVTQIHNDLERRFRRDDMDLAGVRSTESAGEDNTGISGYDEIQEIELESRRAYTVWLDHGCIGSATELELLNIIDGLRIQLGLFNKIALDESRSEVLYAHYPVGGFYGKHIDAHHPGTARVGTIERYFSFILFLNQDEWQPENGGQLRIFKDFSPTGPDIDSSWTEVNPDPDTYTDVNPIPGSLVVFKSRALPHEVLPTTVPRRAVVGWMRVKAHHPAHPGLYSGLWVPDEIMSS
jgi:SM-20-related protein